MLRTARNRMPTPKSCSEHCKEQLCHLIVRKFVYWLASICPSNTLDQFVVANFTSFRLTKSILLEMAVYKLQFKLVCSRASRKRARPKLTIRSSSITQNHRNHDVQTSSIILLLLWSRSSITICASIYYHCSTVDSITIVAMSLHSCSQQQRFRTSAVPSTSHHFSPSEASLRNKP
jgi:hypothetical protein